MDTRRLLTVLCIGFICVMFFFCLFFGNVCEKWYYTVFPKSCAITSEEVSCTESLNNPANNQQAGANVWLGTYDGKIYFYPMIYSDVRQQTVFYQYLSVFDNQSATRLTKLDGNIIGMQDGYVYYHAWPHEASLYNDCGIYSYNISDDSKTLLFSLGDNCFDGYISSTGILYIPADESGEEFYSVSKDSISSGLEQKEFHELNGKFYSIEGAASSQVISCIDENGKKTYLNREIPQGNKSIIRSNNGLLVHNEGQGELLYLIHGETNEVIELFTVPCHFSRSAVNIHGSSIYLSFSRSQFDSSGDFIIPFENDTLSGTYRIDLNTYSSEKISDSVYTGLYIFDSSGIYACDSNCHIYKLDFDGNVITTLLG